MENKIYLNSAAGCKVYPEVIETMNDVLLNHWGNASAETSDGVDARGIINDVTEQVAKDINCNPEEIIWTSGACESNSLAILGYMFTFVDFGVDFVISNVEHTSIEMIAEKIKGNYNVENLIVDYEGKINLGYLEVVLSGLKQDSLISVSYANSEIGVIQDIKEISKLVHKYKCILHVDATQAYPWMHIDVNELGIDMMSVSGQKIGTPRGVGFLYVNNNIEITPMIFGSQNNNLRGGTYPTHLIAAFGKALKIIRNTPERNAKVFTNRNYFLDSLFNSVDGIRLNGPDVTNNRLPNNISVCIDGVNAEKLVIMADMMNVIMARSSACKSYSPEPSKTLMTIGLTEEKALSTVRITIDERITDEEINKAIKIITYLIERIREENA